MVEGHLSSPRETRPIALCRNYNMLHLQQGLSGGYFSISLSTSVRIEGCTRESHANGLNWLNALDNCREEQRKTLCWHGGARDNPSELITQQ